MLNAMSVITRTVDAKIGWNRIGVAISVLVIAVSFAVLYRLLQDIDGAKVVMALRDRSGPFHRGGLCRRQLCHLDLLRLLLVAHDRAACPIGSRRLPPPPLRDRPNLGATVVTGGAVSSDLFGSGLGLIDVARSPS